MPQRYEKISKTQNVFLLFFLLLGVYVVIYLKCGIVFVAQQLLAQLQQGLADTRHVDAGFQFENEFTDVLSADLCHRRLVGPKHTTRKQLAQTGSEVKGGGVDCRLGAVSQENINQSDKGRIAKRLALGHKIAV